MAFHGGVWNGAYCFRATVGRANQAVFKNSASEALPGSRAFDICRYIKQRKIFGVTAMSFIIYLILFIAVGGLAIWLIRTLDPPYTGDEIIQNSGVLNKAKSRRKLGH